MSRILKKMILSIFSTAQPYWVPAEEVLFRMA